MATVTHMPHRITQCYLPPGRCDIPALTPTEADTRLSDPGLPGVMQGLVDLPPTPTWLGFVEIDITYILCILDIYFLERYK